MTPDEALDVIEQQMLAARLAWAEAMLLAGRGGAALPMLTALGDLPLALDLRARIVLRAGRPAAAARLWHDALAVEPGNDPALQGLARLARRRRRARVAIASGALLLGLVTTWRALATSTPSQ